VHNLRVWSKIIILSAPEFTDKSPEKQEDVEDMAATMFHHGNKCVLYNLTFSSVWNDWATKKNHYGR
jgi:hypothetical protein